MRNWIRMFLFFVFPLRCLGEGSLGNVRLVDVLCGFIQENAAGVSSKSWDEFSARFAKKVDEGFGSVSVSLRDEQTTLSQGWSQCHSKFEGLAEEGEFILEVRKSAERSARQAHLMGSIPHPNVHETMEAPVELRLSPDLEIQVGVVRGETAGYGLDGSSVRSLEQVKMRQMEYEAMWSKFLESLRKRLLVSSR